MIITSKRSGLTVEMTDEQYAAYLSKYGPNTYYEILNDAGRVLKHRIILKNIMKQNLTPEQSAHVESLARALAIQERIDREIIDMGYGSYIYRRDRGGMMPESFSRIVEKARGRVGDLSDISPDDSDRNYAMAQLGFYTERDAEWSTCCSKHCNWKITAPAGWGGVA